MLISVVLGISLMGLLFMAIARRRQQGPDAAAAYAFAFRCSLWAAFLLISLLYAFLLMLMDTEPHSFLNALIVFSAIGAIPLACGVSFGLLMPFLYSDELRRRQRVSSSPEGRS